MEQKAAQMDIAHVHVLQLLMGNYTYAINETHVSKFPGRTVKGEQDLDMQTKVTINFLNIKGTYPTISSLSFNNSLMNVRFITCGKRGKSQYDFHQLTIVFNTSIWIAIVMVCVTLSAINMTLTSGGQTQKFATSLIQVYKVFVEQGNPFPDYISSNFRARFILTGLMLAGILISNAYKSVNVYKMTRPRKPLTYDLLDHLINDNFTLYSRVGYVRYWNADKVHGVIVNGSKWTSSVWKTNQYVEYFISRHWVFYEKIMSFTVGIIYQLESNQYNTGQFIGFGTKKDSIIHEHAESTKMLIKPFKILANSSTLMNTVTL